MALRLVLDTNVWLDWLVFNDPGVAALRAAVEDGRALVFIDAECCAELERVLAYPLRKPPLDAAQRQSCLERCRRYACLVEADGSAEAPLPRCSDPDDQKFLRLAARAEAGFLLSKDRALLDLAGRAGLPFHILSPAGFGALPGVESDGQQH